MGQEKEAPVFSKARVEFKDGSFVQLSEEQFLKLKELWLNSDLRCFEIQQTVYSVSEIKKLSPTIYFRDSVTDLASGITTFQDYKKLT